MLAKAFSIARNNPILRLSLFCVQALYGMQGAQPVEERTAFLKDVEETYQKW
jgi:hypothetical protein